MKLSILIPVFNEEKTIGSIIDAVVAADIGDIKKEIIVIDDGSKDKTKTILQEYSKGMYSRKYNISYCAILI